MNRTITALFDSRDDADRAKSRLLEAGVSDVNITAQGAGYGDDLSTGTPGYTGATAAASFDSPTTATTTSAAPVLDVTEGDYGDDDRNRDHGGGLWGSIKRFFSDDDRPAYEEGLRRGHVLLTAHVDDDRADEAIRILEDTNAIDVDAKTEEWRSSGWTGGETAYRDTDGDISTNRAYADTSARTATDTRDEAIPIVEETLRVGKREVGRGGVRVRSYTVETPVEEQVSLREEHVNVERRAVDLPLSAADDAFRDRTIELTETSEEAVISKEARVTEELRVSKDVDTRIETVSDTVRHTEVDVDDTRGETRSFSNAERTTDVDLIDGETEDERRLRLARGTTTGTSSTI